MCFSFKLKTYFSATIGVSEKKKKRKKEERTNLVVFINISLLRSSILS